MNVKQTIQANNKLLKQIKFRSRHGNKQGCLMKNKICIICGNKFTITKQYHYKKYCCMRCKSKAYRLEHANKIGHEKECKICGKKFYGYKEQTCSVKCGIKLANKTRDKRIIIKCEHCGKKVLYKRSEFVRTKNHFCGRKCHDAYRKIHMKGKNSPSYKTGKKITKKGYVLILSLKHPYRNAGGYILEHRLVVEKKIERYLTKEEVIHHIDLNKQNNHIDNLMLFKTNSEHIKFHTKMKQFGITNPIKRQIKNRWKEFAL